MCTFLTSVEFNHDVKQSGTHLCFVQRKKDLSFRTSFNTKVIFKASWSDQGLKTETPPDMTELLEYSLCAQLQSELHPVFVFEGSKIFQSTASLINTEHIIGSIWKCCIVVVWRNSYQSKSQKTRKGVWEKKGESL